jgi:hypothetical protein
MFVVRMRAVLRMCASRRVCSQRAMRDESAIALSCRVLTASHPWFHGVLPPEMPVLTSRKRE